MKNRLCCIFYVAKDGKYSTKMKHVYCKKEEYEKKLKEIEKLDEFMEFSLDDGSYKQLTKSEK